MIKKIHISTCGNAKYIIYVQKKYLIDKSRGKGLILFDKLPF